MYFLLKRSKVRKEKRGEEKRSKGGLKGRYLIVEVSYHFYHIHTFIHSHRYTHTLTVTHTHTHSHLHKKHIHNSSFSSLFFLNTLLLEYFLCFIRDCVSFRSQSKTVISKTKTVFISFFFIFYEKSEKSFFYCFRGAKWWIFFVNF